MSYYVLNRVRVFSLIALQFAIGINLYAQDAPPPSIDDVFFNHEGIREISFAPDGQSVAFIRHRSINSLPVGTTNVFGIVPDNDVWLQDSPGRPARNLTNGGSDASGSWAPRWSPDGQRLAFLSSRGGNVTLWLWERNTNKVRQISNQGVSNPETRFGRNWSYQWVDNDRIICTVPTKGEMSPPEVEYFASAMRLPQEAWEKARRGEQTASAISSTEFKYPEESLFVLDVVSGKGRRIATTINRQAITASTFADWWLSPNGKNVALTRPVPSAYNSAANARMGYPHAVELRTIDGELIKLDKLLPENIHTQTFKWSPDGKEIAFFANGSGPVNPILLYGIAAAEVMPNNEKRVPLKNPAKLYRLNIEKKTIEQVETGDIELGQLGAPDFLWTAAGELIFKAPRREVGKISELPASRGTAWGWNSWNGEPIGPPAPREWIVLSREGKTRPLTKEMSVVPEDLWSINGGAYLLCLLDGELWSINSSTGNAKNLTKNFTPRVGNFYRPPIQPALDPSAGGSLLMGVNAFPPTVEKIVLIKEGPKAPDSYQVLDVSTGVTKQLLNPAQDTSLTAFAQKSLSAIFRGGGADGTSYLFRTSADGNQDKLVETNSGRNNFVHAQAKIFEYTSLNGEKLKGQLVLPHGYKPGRKYPLWVEVRMGVNISGTVGPLPQVSYPGTSDVFAAAGFAFVVPSIPINIPGMGASPLRRSNRYSEIGAEEGDSCLMPINGVLPAIEKLIEMGIADPDRLFLSGGSRGGWTTLCLVTQTTRFKAAVAYAGYADLTFTGIGGLTRSFGKRYSENPFDEVSPSGHWPKNYRPSDVPWWRDEDRNRRNSPLYYADRVQTPLMLIHGDVDFVDLTQSEDFFRAMVSMRKPAQFVRYWGEAHGNQIPANIRDFYIRHVAWWDQWGDIARDDRGNVIWDGDRVKGRNGAPPLKVEDYAKFVFFQPNNVKNQKVAATTPEQ